MDILFICSFVFVYKIRFCFSFTIQIGNEDVEKQQFNYLESTHKSTPFFEKSLFNENHSPLTPLAKRLCMETDDGLDVIKNRTKTLFNDHVNEVEMNDGIVCNDQSLLFDESLHLSDFRTPTHFQSDSETVDCTPLPNYEKMMTPQLKVRLKIVFNN